MILERLKVEGFRHLAAPYEFVPDERLTIISAPNGSGKSTLLDALYHGLLEKHTVSGTVACERFLSRGRTLVPRVVIDFRAGDSRYRLRKHFLTEKLSRLERWESGRYLPLREGAASDDFVREIFAADAPARGAIDTARHWGFAHILWSPNSVYAAVPSTAADHVRSMLTEATLTTPGERAVEQRVADRYTRYFTDSGGFARSMASANLPALDHAVDVARAAVAQALTAVEHLDALRHAYENSHACAARLAAERGRLRQQLEETKRRAASFDAVASQRQVSAGAEDYWQQHSRDLKLRIDAIVKMQATRAAVRIKRVALKSKIDALAGDKRVLAEVVTTSRAATDEAAALLAQVQERAADVTAASLYVADLDDIRLLTERVGQIEAEIQAIARLEEQRAGICAPTKAELRALRQLDIERRSLEATIAASSLALELQLDVDAGADILIGDRSGHRRLTSGNADVITGSDQIVVIVRGFGRITARGPDSAAAARSKHAELVTRIHAANERFAVASIEELEICAERAADIDREIVMHRRSLLERLDRELPATIRERLTDIQKRVDATESKRPLWCEQRPDARALRAAFDADLQQAALAERNTKRYADNAKHRYDACHAEGEKLFAAERELAHEEQQQSLRLDDLRSDGRDDAQRETALVDSSLEWSAARGQRQVFDRQLDAFGDNPHHTQMTIEVQEREAGERYEDSHGHAQRDFALLEEFIGRGSYLRLAQAEENLAALVEQQRVESADADAIRLLSGMFAMVRKERIDAVLTPVESRASHFLTRIAGPSLGPINVGADLTPRSVRQCQTGDLLPIGSTLSTGEREQIYIATRFAIADVIAGTRGRQLFVLDDILTGTDPVRLCRFMALLEELSRERLQVIVTTTDASRYLGKIAAKHIDLRVALAMANAA